MAALLRLFWLLLLLWLLPIGGAATTSGAVRSSAPIDLGTLGGSASEATDVNNSGWVVGNSDVRDHYSHTYGSASRAFVWHDGAIHDLGSLGGAASGVASADERYGIGSSNDWFAGNSINDRGHVVGWSLTARRDKYGEFRTEHAFVWSGGKLSDIGTLGGADSRALALNDQGTVIGLSELKGQRAGAYYGCNTSVFVWRAGRMENVAPPDADGRAGWPIGIDARGQLIASSCRDSHESFLWSDGRIRDLAPYSADVINDRGESFGINGRYWALLQNGKLKHAGRMRVGVESFTPIAMNNAAQVVGYCTPHRTNAPRPCLWHAGITTFLKQLPQTSTGRAFDINERGQIVGRMRTSAAGRAPSYNAVVWAQGTIRKLPGVGGRSSAALAISDRGDVVGWSMTGSGQRHATLWKAAAP